MHNKITVNEKIFVRRSRRKTILELAKTDLLVTKLLEDKELRDQINKEMNLTHSSPSI